MVMPADNGNTRPAWFVGASYGGTDDQTERFLRRGIWENGYTDRYLNTVKSIAEGDRIAIKSAYVRSNPDGLPFDNRGNPVSVMAIKAIGTVTQNMGDGRRLRVAWVPVNPAKEWYFYTYRATVWEVRPGTWATDQLIGFVFDNQPQDIDGFRNDPYWVQRFGDSDDSSQPYVPASPELTRADTYTIDHILTDGCFLGLPKLETMLNRLQTKQNIILQGPPGTGKTWLAKRLAYALIGYKDDSKVRPFQFHPNLSYEDFVRGWRPQGDGSLTLVDGPFLQLADEARNYPDGTYVIVIEEINRGNPASIFGEMLTLLEADKRKRDEALALAYPRTTAERFYIPPNVYVIGTMNVADRSLALVDLALRRRFAFFDLEPIFDNVWRDWVSEQSGIPTGFLARVAQSMNALNDQIATDRNLGRQFRIGHSYFTPGPGVPIGDEAAWYRGAVEAEIAPLLQEYWFDNPDAASAAVSQLLNGL